MNFPQRRLWSLCCSSLNNVLLASFLALTAAGCVATSPPTIRAYEAATLRGVPYRLTRIPVSSAPLHSNVQAAAGSVWATQASMLGLHKTIRVDQKSLRVTYLSRPFTAELADLLVTEDSLWFSDGMNKLTGSGELYRTDITTNRRVAANTVAGKPFGVGKGTIWSHNARTQMVTGINTKTNEVRFRHAVAQDPGNSSFTFGAGSIWQFIVSESVDGVGTQGIVFRIDPRTGRTTARIDVGSIQPTDVVRFVAGDIWVLGKRATNGNAVAVRINTQNNSVRAIIRLVADIRICAAGTFPKTPASDGTGIWISTFCSHVHRVPGILLKIDLETNKVSDELRLTALSEHQGGQPALTSAKNGIWGFDGRSAFRIEFRHGN